MATLRDMLKSGSRPRAGTRRQPPTAARNANATKRQVQAKPEPAVKPRGRTKSTSKPVAKPPAAKTRRAPAPARIQPSTPPQPPATPLEAAMALQTTRLGTLTRTQQQAIDQFFNQIPRHEIQATLARSPAADARSRAKQQRLLSLLSDDAYAADQWPSLCVKADIAPYELMRAIIDAYIHDGKLLLARHIPGVMDGIGASATDHEEPCWLCDNGEGSQGTLEGLDKKGDRITVVCNMCSGKKIVRVRGDHASRRLALEAMDMLGGKGPGLAQQFNFGPGSGQPQPLPQSPGAGGGEKVPDMADWSTETDAVFEEHDGQQPMYDTQPQPLPQSPAPGAADIPETEYA